MGKLPCSRPWLPILLLTFLLVPWAMWGHGMEGDRMFIEALATEDANIKNELVLPRGEFLTLPDGSFRTFGASLEKSLYPERWSFVVEQSIVSRRELGQTVSGFGDLEIGTKVAVYRNERHEFVLTPVYSWAFPPARARSPSAKSSCIRKFCLPKVSAT